MTAARAAPPAARHVARSSSAVPGLLLAVLLTGCSGLSKGVPATAVAHPTTGASGSSQPAGTTAPRGSSTASQPSPAAVTPSPAATPPRVLLPGEAAGLPPAPPGVPFTGRLLIAERGNGRLLQIGADGTVDWTFPQPGQTLAVHFGAPDDAFFTPDGRSINANAEESQTVTAVDRASGTVLWQVGHNGVRGHAAGYFNEPDDAVPAVDGTIWVADIRNCRLVHLGGDGRWLGTRGDGRCRHLPPTSFAQPNGAFPARDGSTIVTEISGGWVTWLNPDGSVRWTVRSPARYPSDAVPYPDGSVLLTDYSTPGAVFHLDPTGKVLWSYRPTGAARLDHTSIAIPLASNRVAICDDFQHRIVVVDPSTSQVVWTFTGQGTTRLSFPDGLDYLLA